jgi:hypothetical protein
MSTRSNNNTKYNTSKANNLKSIPATFSGKTISAYLSTNTFLIVVVVVCVVSASIYFYREYKSLAEKTKAKLRKETEPNSCPDYWEIVDKAVDETGKVKSLKCKNVQHIGKVALNPGDDTITFDDEIFTNPNTRDIARCQWAKQNGVAWSGYERFC